MGDDGYSNTYGYCINGDIPSFKVFRETTGELIDMVTSDSFEWSNNQIYNVKSLDEYILPNEHKLLNAYPNPFNPSTSISFQVAEDSYVALNVYNIYGQLVENIVKQEFINGYYSFDWDARDYGSGIYFIRLNIDNKYYETKKVVLVK